jgi:hypothetical protein
LYQINLIFDAFGEKFELHDLVGKPKTFMSLAFLLPKIADSITKNPKHFKVHILELVVDIKISTQKFIMPSCKKKTQGTDTSIFEKCSQPFWLVGHILRCSI